MNLLIDWNGLSNSATHVNVYPTPILNIKIVYISFSQIDIRVLHEAFSVDLDRNHLIVQLSRLV